MLHEEINAVIGSSRLPSLSDRAKLPYTEAVAKEVFRWNTVAPNGLPHRVTQDDVYDGYLIPENATIIANLEGMLHDPRLYQDPYSFDPTRFLPELSGRPAERDPHSIGFGFGRRKCPSIRVADASIWIASAMIGSVLDVQKAKVNGKVVDSVYEKMPGTVSHPKTYKVSIAPRSQKALELLQRG